MMTARCFSCLLALSAFAVPALAHPFGGHLHPTQNFSPHLPEPTSQRAPVRADRQPPPAAETPATEPEAAWLRTLLRKPEVMRVSELLRVRQAQAPLLVYGSVRNHQSHDNGSLHTAQLDIKQIYRGDLSVNSIALADLRGAMGAPAYMTTSVPQFLLLKPAPGHSYLRQHLGNAPHYLLAHSADSHYPKLSQQSAEAFAHWLALGSSQPSLQTRKAAIALLSAENHRVRRWALAELALVPTPEKLTKNEWQQVAQIMQSSAATKGELARYLANWQLQEALQWLNTSAADAPEVRAQILSARTRLGQPPTMAQLLQTASSANPAERAATAWVVAAQANPQAIATLEQLATTDPHRDVRRVAIAALGQSQHPQAIAALTKAMDSEQSALRLEAGRALLNFEGQDFSKAMEQVIRNAYHWPAREHAARLMVYRVGTESLRVQLLRESVESRSLYRILSEGVINERVLHVHDH